VEYSKGLRRQFDVGNDEIFLVILFFLTNWDILLRSINSIPLSSLVSG
jgi:hypothetical protein